MITMGCLSCGSRRERPSGDVIPVEGGRKHQSLTSPGSTGQGGSLARNLIFRANFHAL